MSAVDQYLASRSLQVASSDGGRPTFRTLNQYNQTYWGGLDAAIYFDDLYIGEVIALHYEEQESVYPLFGYSDFVKRGTIHGARRVMGQFTINFQQALMMYLILEHIRAGGGTEAELESFIPVRDSPVKLTSTSVPQNSKAAIASGVNMLAPEAVSRLSELSAYDYGSENAQSTRMTSAIRKVKSATLNNIASNAQRLKEQFKWTAPGYSGIDANNPGATIMQAVQNSIYAQGYQSKYETESGFTIGIVLGETDLNKYEGTYRGTSSVLIPTDFDEAYFKAAAHMDKSDVAAALQEMPPATVLQITGVDITGHGMTIDDSGRPLLQTYSFIASDITTKLS